MPTGLQEVKGNSLNGKSSPNGVYFDLQYSRVPSHLISLGNFSAQIFEKTFEVLEDIQEVELRQLFQVENNYLKCRIQF